jgi:N-methylhydantoinase B/oxoprolinase/acetone carboxylase alpha subunit
MGLVPRKLLGDRTLIEQIRHTDSLTEGGFYHGLELLVERERDPITYERFYDAVHSAVMGARETSKNVAASPGARELGELLFALLTPEGHAVAVSSGLVGHQGAFRIAIKYMAENGYDRNPGIRPGDIFLACDPATSGTPHPGDVYTFIPLFSGEELIGWAAGMNHTMEAGGSVPGAWPPWSPNTFTDGYLVPPTKVGENYEDYTWLYKQFERRTRAPMFNILDEKMRVAGCKMVIDSVTHIIDKFGLDYFKATSREIIEETRRICIDNVKMLTIPGRTRYVSFRTVPYKGIVDGVWPQSAHNWLLHLHTEVQINTVEGKLHINWDKISPANFHALGGYQGILESNLWLNVMDAIGLGLKPNSGMNLAVTYDMPQGALFNPPSDKYSAGNPWSSSVPLFNGFSSGLETSKRARGFVEESWNADLCWTGIQGEITLKDGFSFGFCQMDLLGASATPARPYMDGEPLGTAWWNPSSDTGSVEEWEYVLPGIYYLCKNVLPGYCGHGKFRGGLGMQLAFVVSDEVKEAIIGKVGATTGNYFTGQASVPGGSYPAPTSTLIVYRGTNVLELMRNGEYPGGIEELYEWIDQGKFTHKGREVHKEEVGALLVRPGDVYIVVGNATGGWGDPLHRAIDRVEQDVKENFVTVEAAAEIYGVPLGDDASGSISVTEGAVAKRAEIRRAREATSVPFEEFWRTERQGVVNGDMHEFVADAYAELKGFSTAFKQDFESFWQLDEETIGAEHE